MVSLAYSLTLGIEGFSTICHWKNWRCDYWSGRELDGWKDCLFGVDVGEELVWMVLYVWMVFFLL